MKGIHFDFATTTEHDEEAKLLAERYKNCRTVPGTRSLHNSVEVRQVSLSPVKRIERVFTTQIETFPLSSIKGFVIVAYDAVG